MKPKLCARSRCRNFPALWWNEGSQDFYCTRCARKINDECRRTRKRLLCRPVFDKETLVRMERAQRNARYLIHDKTENLFWHNGDDPENDGFRGWGSPETASRYTPQETDRVETLPGRNSVWVCSFSATVTDWVDPELVVSDAGG